MDLVNGYKWATCSFEMQPVTNMHHHIVRKGGLNTLCGHSATHPEIWRANKRKPECQECLTAARRAGILVPRRSTKREESSQ